MQVFEKSDKLINILKLNTIKSYDLVEIFCYTLPVKNMEFAKTGL